MYQFYLTQYDGKFLGPIAKVLGYIFSAIYSLLAHIGIDNAAVTIVLFTFCVNILMLPLTIKQQKFSKMQSKMQPEMQKIQKKYKGKKDNASMQAQQEEMQALYKKYGTSPAGGCLPMIVTMIVFFALYKVIYAIPAYVPQIKSIYDTVAKLTTNNPEALQYVLDAGKDLRVTGVSWSDMNLDTLHGNRDYIIDCFTKFGKTNWDALTAYFSGGDSDMVARNAHKIMKVNSLFGTLNLAETPMAKPWPGFVIPVLCTVLQFLQTKLMMNNSNMAANPEDPTQASMKMMNKTMPLVSGAICLSFPIGNGIYLASSSLFRIISQLIINKSMEDMDIEQEIEKNLEKEHKKREKLHLEASDGSIKNIAKMKISNVDDDNNSSKKYEKGSISAIAHMRDSKED